MAARSGMPLTASNESSTPPNRLPPSFGETRTVYAGWPATSVGVAPETSACLLRWAIASSILATVGTSCWSLAGVLGAGSAFAGGRRVAVERVGGGVVQRQRVPVVEDLGVALLGLQLQAHVAVLGDPQPAGGAGDQRAGGQSRPSVPAGREAGAFEQVVGERDARADALDLFPAGPAERVVDRLRERLGRRRRARRRARGERRGGDADDDHQPAQQQQAREGETSEDVHRCASTSFWLSDYLPG